MILLSHDAHQYHTRGRFALELFGRDPDGHSPSLRFWWLWPSDYDPDQASLIIRPRFNCDPQGIQHGDASHGHLPTYPFSRCDHNSH